MTPCETPPPVGAVSTNRPAGSFFLVRNVTSQMAGLGLCTGHSVRIRARHACTHPPYAPGPNRDSCRGATSRRRSGRRMSSRHTLRPTFWADPAMQKGHCRRCGPRPRVLSCCRRPAPCHQHGELVSGCQGSCGMLWQRGAYRRARHRVLSTPCGTAEASKRRAGAFFSLRVRPRRREDSGGVPATKRPPESDTPASTHLRPQPQTTTAAAAPH
jgi:hypothetical protein